LPLLAVQTGLRLSELVGLDRHAVTVRLSPIEADFAARLRHTAAMELLQAGVDCLVIALWLGHESIEAALATLKPYERERQNDFGPTIKCSTS
jgi:integrase